MTTLYCTTITRNYVQYARTLALSLARHEPSARLLALMLDRPGEPRPAEPEPFDVVYLEDLDQREITERMRFYYTPFELCCATRPFLHAYIYERQLAERWMFLDSDIYVCAPLVPLAHELDDASILLKPHIVAPAAEPWAHYEHEFLSAGIFNAGFMGLRRTPETLRFIQWHRERLTFHCRVEPGAPFVDQAWLNFAPTFFEGVSVSRDPGVNLGHWNLHAVELTRAASGEVRVDGRPLLFAHFSGFDPHHPERVSKHSVAKADPIWLTLASEYAAQLIGNGHVAQSAAVSRLGQFSDGQPITHAMRRIYLDMVMKRAVPFRGSPFDEAAFFMRELWRRRARELLADPLGIVARVSERLKNVLR